jgi:hypothetical protein
MSFTDLRENVRGTIDDKLRKPKEYFAAMKANQKKL